MSLTLVLPPLTQLNTPYPSISYLAQDLRRHGIECHQRDLGIEMVLRIFSRSGLEEIFDTLEKASDLPEPAWRALSLKKRHLEVIEPTIEFLQGGSHAISSRILETGFLPGGPRMQRANLESFGIMGSHDAARHLATLYLADLADLITSCIDEGFALARYQAHLATGARYFDPLWQRLSDTSIIDRHLDALSSSIQSDVVGVSVPFPGNLYGALRIGKALRARGLYVVMGGGYINTELRDAKEPRLWECVDAMTFDDGEGPLRAILEYRAGGPDHRHRTRTAEQEHSPQVRRPAFTCAPYYGDLNLQCYLQTIDTLNPAHRLWADGRWNKITLAHGCYWKRCTFCDISLDYIGHYETADASALVDQIERLIEETGTSGFHFVDEAAPPKVLRALAIELLRRGTQISFWGNIRFEKSYDSNLCRLLAAAGLIAVTGGLEVANSRLLTRIDKGVTVEQVARCAAHFGQAGVMVHAYLMYGFPGQTEQETMDSMELVRQLFAEGLIHSAFWHRFVLTRHAPIFSNPEKFGVELVDGGEAAFAQNDVEHRDLKGGNHDLFDEVLPQALEAWLQGQALGRDVCSWFNTPMPAPRERPSRIRDSIAGRKMEKGSKPKARLLWIGGSPLAHDRGLTLHTSDAEAEIECSEGVAQWLSEILHAAEPSGEGIRLDEALKSFPGNWLNFAQEWETVLELGLLLL